jgi:hypothetical protein
VVENEIQKVIDDEEGVKVIYGVEVNLLFVEESGNRVIEDVVWVVERVNVILIWVVQCVVVDYHCISSYFLWVVMGDHQGVDELEVVVVEVESSCRDDDVVVMLRRYVV